MSEHAKNDKAAVGGIIRLLVLVDTALCQIKVAEDDLVISIVDLVKGQGNLVIDRYLGPATSRQIFLYRLDPPLARKELITADQYTVNNLEDLMKTRRKIRLNRTMMVEEELADVVRDVRYVSVYIEKAADVNVGLEGEHTESSRWSAVDSDISEGMISLQDAVNASEEMELAIRDDLNLTGDLFVLLDNPLVALVFGRGATGSRHYLKLLRPSREAEVDILAYLAGIDSPDNHAVRPIASLQFEVGTLLLLPDAGITVCDYKDLQKHLFSISSQFLHGVAFLHEHKVAHCDLKTSNVVVDRDTGHVTLIDFDLAVRGRDWLEGFSGTDGWTAPEVGVAARYDPLRADVWAAGKVLNAICEECTESADLTFLVGLSEKMMVADPRARLSMKGVINSLDAYPASRAT